MSMWTTDPCTSEILCLQLFLVLLCFVYPTQLPSFLPTPGSPGLLEIGEPLITPSCSSHGEPDSSLCSWPKGDENSNGHPKQSCRDLWETSLSAGSNTAALNGSGVTVRRRPPLFYGLAPQTAGLPWSFPHGWQPLWELAHALATLPSIPHRASSQQMWVIWMFPLPKCSFQGPLGFQGPLLTIMTDILSISCLPVGSGNFENSMDEFVKFWSKFRARMNTC